MHGRANEVQSARTTQAAANQRRSCEQTNARGGVGSVRVGSVRVRVGSHLIQMIDLSPYVGIRLSMSVTARQTHATSLHCDLAAL